MKRTLVTGSAGHLGEALMRHLSATGVEPAGVDILPSRWTSVVAPINDPDAMRECLRGIDVVMHTAALHKPHVVTHSKQAFVDTNVSGTLALLEAAAAEGVEAFIYTSTTSVFGAALVPPPGQPAAWITEDVVPVPRNIYGVTKAAAEDLCHLFHRLHGLPVVVLRTSRFFPEEDDDPARRTAFDDLNLKGNEMLFRRVDLQDVVDAHVDAADRATEIEFGRFIVSATTPFRPEDAGLLRDDVDAVLRKRFPEYPEIYAANGWRMMESIDRVYVNDAARASLGWEPRFDFAQVLRSIERGEDFRSDLSRAVGIKGYHTERFEEGPYPVE